MIYHYYAEKGGWRIGILFHEGHKWIKLLDTSNLNVERFPKEQVRYLKPVKLRPKTMARRLKQRRALYKKCNLSYSNKTVDSVIKKLEI